jgi:phage replication initiation protein
MTEKNKIIYDYLSFTTRIHSIGGLIDLLGLEKLKFQLIKGFYGYRDRLYYDGIHIHHNGTEEMGICVELSGQGCRNFETHGKGDYDGIFDLILEHYNDISELREMNITRLDVAYDDFQGLLNIKKLVTEAKKGNYVSRMKDVQVIFSNKGCSVNHGSNKSNIYIRIYDKKMERKREDIDHWVRCELQMRKDNARGFIKLKNNIDKNYFDTLNNYLRYVIPSENETNKRMLPTAKYWSKWLESFGTVSIFDKPGADYNIAKCEDYVFRQAGNAIDCILKMQGVETFLDKLKEKKPPQNVKYKALAEEYERIKKRKLAK